MNIRKIFHRCTFVPGTVETDLSKRRLYFIDRCCSCGREFIHSVPVECGTCLFQGSKHCPPVDECRNIYGKPNWIIGDATAKKYLATMDDQKLKGGE